MMRRTRILARGVRVVGAGALAIWLSGVIGCSSHPRIELPPPETGQFLTLEEQRALSSEQLTAYCQSLNDYIASLKQDIALSRAMHDSLSAVLDSLNAEHSSMNNESRLLENQLRRLKARRGSTTVYTTRQGDTLMSLARLFFGSPQEWRRLYEANRDVIDNPGEPLEPGLRLSVPPR
ncbi:MAG: hypothetical protein GF330_09810 [Candidatus Eisenbacteria bacterium]|nr:hypothetical protein [Candidatus Eisenbacteria bacterium]